MRYIIGIDLGGTNLKVALFDHRLKVKDMQVLSTRVFKTKEGLIKIIIDSIKDIIRRNKLSTREILGVGLGLPGPVDAKKGIVHFFPNIPGWNEVPLKKILNNRLSLPIFIDNDVNLMALAEYRAGAAKNSRNAVCLTLGTGIGAGIIIEGRLYRGSSYAAGEIGHIPINEKGPACNCGGSACIESYVGNLRIINLASKIFKRKIGLEELSGLAGKRNRLALKIWRAVGEKLGIALAGVTNLLNPDCIVIGGGVANAGRILFDSIRDTIKQRAMTTPAQHVKILKAKLGNSAGLIGAALLVKERGEL
ncbi:MAG: ROK family protein [Candidatus Omnitrophota bacterium]|nr:ROK family protein [Candidatus Omnitrophota bacterium]